MQCARHPKVETELTCGRCGTPICPSCVVFTDVGARCPSCAPSRKLPQFEVGPIYLLRGALAGIGVGAAVGAVWGALLPGPIWLLGLLAAAGVGYLIGEAISVATNRKSGTPLQVIAIVAVLVAYFARNLVIGDGLLPSDDVLSYVAVVIAGVVAMGRLRY